MKAKKITSIVLSSLALASLVWMIASLFLEKGMGFYSSLALTLAILFALSALVLFLMGKWTGKEEKESKIDEDKATIICPHCGKENPAGSVYCNQCGSLLR